MAKFPFIVVIILAALALPSEIRAAGDLAKGESIFEKCEGCHSVKTPQNRLGPHLVGLFGRKAASIETFQYSEAMKQSGLVWNEKTLDKYVRDPEVCLEGTRMSFIGINKKDDRANLIAYLKEASRR